MDDGLKSDLKDVAAALTNLIESTDAPSNVISKKAEALDNNTSVAVAAASDVIQKLCQLLDQKTCEINRMKIEEEDETGIQTQNMALDVQLFDSLRSFVNDLLSKDTVFKRHVCLPDVRARLKQFDQTSRHLAASEMTPGVPSSAELLVKRLSGCHVTLEEDIALQQSAWPCPNCSDCDRCAC